MRISARNQLRGTVTAIKEGAVNGIVTIDVNGCAVSATISMASIKDLGLEVGKEAIAVIKATEVMIGLGEMKLSARNKFAGTVTAINRGAVNAIVTLEACGGNVLSSTISLAAVDELGLEVGKEAVAVIKATSVMVAVD